MYSSASLCLIQFEPLIFVQSDIVVLKPAQFSLLQGKKKELHNFALNLTKGN